MTRLGTCRKTLHKNWQPIHQAGKQGTNFVPRCRAPAARPRSWLACRQQRNNAWRPAHRRPLQSIFLPDALGAATSAHQKFGLLGFAASMFKLVHPRSWDPVQLHDWFNLFIIAVLNIENVTYLATGAGFQLFFTSAMVYFLLDTIFVGLFPQCVKSPVVILCHHICTALYMLIPYSYPRYQWCMAYCMLVEVNTWLLIARRTLGGKLLDVLFYASWVLLRNIFYPYLIWAFYKEWRVETQLAGTPWNWILVTPICQAFLSGLNYHWTLQLVVKVLRTPRGGKYSKHL